MKRKIATWLWLTLPLLAFGEQVFRSDGDGCRELLQISGDRYVLESWRLDGKQTSRTGSVVQDAQSVTLHTNEGRKAQRYVKRRFDGVLYLVAPTREQEFAEAGRESDWFIRTTSLGAYFHEMTEAKPEKQANQASEPTATGVTPPAGAGDRAAGSRGSP